MTTSDILSYRLINQQIAETAFKKPEEIVRWLTAMQAQEFAHVKWAIGLRLPETNDSIVEKTFNDGLILRTHAMRPTWHFVAPADIRWLQKLTAPRVHAVNAFMYRQSELDQAVLRRSRSIIIKTLEGGKHLTRDQLNAALAAKKIIAKGFRLAYIIMHAELEGIICSGPRQGKKFTYALLDERAPAVKSFDKEEALAEFTHRYFTTRGPATIQDFIWWSGLTAKEARDGIASLPSDFVFEKVGGHEYIYKPIELKKASNLQSTFLLPDYDEYVIAYKNRGALSSKNFPKGISPYSHFIVVDGVIEGTWQQSVKKGKVVVDVIPFHQLNKSGQQRVKTAVKRFTSFMTMNNSISTLNE